MVDDRSAHHAGVRVRPATAQLWDDVATVFGTRGDPARCWCQWFRMRNDGWRAATTASNRTALRAQLDAAADGRSGGPPSPGVLAYTEDGEPVGWCAIAPRASYPRVLASQVLRAAWSTAAETDDPDVWSLTCFVVRVGHRRQGVAGTLLDGALGLARSHGARAVEAYPVDVAAKPSVSASELYHGPLHLFVARGFREVARSGSARAVVRLDL